MALNEQDKDEIRAVVVEVIGELVDQHGTYGEIRNAFKEEAKAARKAERDAAKAEAESEPTEAAVFDPPPTKKR